MDSVPTEALGPLLSALAKTGRPYNEAAVREAYDFAARAHGVQKRRSGEPFVTHTVAVAAILVELLGTGVDETLVQAALLHHVVEDTDRVVYVHLPSQPAIETCTLEQLAQVVGGGYGKKVKIDFSEL